MNEKEKSEVKTLLDSLEHFAKEWRKRNTDIARPFVLEATVDLYREKLLGVKRKPRNTLTIICS